MKFVIEGKWTDYVSLCVVQDSISVWQQKRRYITTQYVPFQYITNL